MKVKITYYVPVEQEIEMTPEQYCKFHAGGAGDTIIPEDAIRTEVILSEDAQEELDNFFFEKRG